MATQPRMTSCKLCGKDTPEGNKFCQACYWNAKWAKHILNSPELAQRRKRSHLLTIKNLDPYAPSATFQGSAKEPYFTTLTSCSCKDFALGHGAYPCKHIFRLAEELGLFQSEHFKDNDDDYTMHVGDSKRRALLPEQLQGVGEPLIERFVTLLHFITKGVHDGERLLRKAQKKLKEAATDSAREKAQKDIKSAGKALLKRRGLRFSQKNDDLLDQLENLGLIKTLPSAAKTLSRTVVLTKEVTSKQAEAILNVYRGIYPPLITLSVTPGPLELLDKIAIGKHREECVLRSPDATETPKWAFHVPRCFNDALDIKLISRRWNCVEYTVWTQGVNFSFKAGDILYRDFREYLRGTPTIFVESATSARGTQVEELNLGENSLEIGVADRENNATKEAGLKEYYPGSVTLKNYVTGDVTTITQMDFVKMLIGSNRS